jgi:cytochrome c553
MLGRSTQEDLSMNRFRAYMFGSALLVFLFSAAAVQPVIAQQDQATHIFHRLIPAGDTCASCHKVVYDQWKASPHGANGVECAVCHGETTAKDFAGKPALSTCAACHSDQVAQLKSDPFMKGKTCANCHQAHIFVEHKKAAPAGE